MLLTKRTIGNQGILGVGEIVFPKKEPLNWLSNAKWSALKAYLEGTNRLSRLRKYVFIHMCRKQKLERP